jgi:hypothetical protein
MDGFKCILLESSKPRLLVKRTGRLWVPLLALVVVVVHVATSLKLAPGTV